MKYNHLYKCTDCFTVKATDTDWGDSTWSIICRPCGQVLTEHLKIEVRRWSYKGFAYKGFDGIPIVCLKEKDDDGTGEEETKADND